MRRRSSTATARGFLGFGRSKGKREVAESLDAQAAEKETAASAARKAGLEAWAAKQREAQEHEGEAHRLRVQSAIALATAQVAAQADAEDERAERRDREAREREQQIAGGERLLAELSPKLLALADQRDASTLNADELVLAGLVDQAVDKEREVAALDTEEAALREQLELHALAVKEFESRRQELLAEGAEARGAAAELRERVNTTGGRSSDVQPRAATSGGFERSGEARSGRPATGLATGRARTSSAPRRRSDEHGEWRPFSNRLKRRVE